MLDVSNLSFRDQFEAAVIVSGVCLAAAVLLREWFTDREIRIMARVLGVAGWAVVVTFAWRMTETNETLATQIMVEGKIDATSIADSVRIVAVASEYTATVAGKAVSLIRFSDGRFGSVSVGNGRGGSISDRNRNGNERFAIGDGTIDGADGSTVSVPTRQSGVRF